MPDARSEQRRSVRDDLDRHPKAVLSHDDRFGVAVEESDRTLLLRLMGDFDLTGVDRVENALGRLSRAPAPQRVVFDLRGLTFLDLAALRDDRDSRPTGTK